MWKIIFFGCLILHSALSKNIRISSVGNPEVVNPVKSIYDFGTNSIYYADYNLNKDSNDYVIYRYDISEDSTYRAYIEGPRVGFASFIVPVKTGDSLTTFAVGFESFVGLVHWDGKSRSARIVDELFSLADRLGPNERVGTGHRDPSGHSLYVGTLSLDFCRPAANQSVYVKQRGHHYRQVLTDLKGDFGYGFTDGHVYIIDSCTLKLYGIPTSKCKGPIGKPYIAFDFKSIGKTLGKFIPLGVEADSNGILYTASCYSGKIYAVDLSAQKASAVAQLPTQNGLTSLTSLKFSGPEAKDLYVTVGKEVIDFSTGKVIAKQHPETALYKIEGLAKSILFERYLA